MSLRDYKIGNALRGPRFFVASSDRNAWKEGTRGLPVGMLLWLEREEPVADGVVSAQAARVLSEPQADWVTVRVGYSGEKWPPKKRVTRG